MIRASGERMVVVFEPSTENPTRRRVIWTAFSGLSAAGALWWWRNIGSPAAIPASDSGEEVLIADFSASGEKLNSTRVRKIVRPKSEWWARLTPQQYYVLREHSTDTPFTGTYYRMHENGLYRCLGCENALFDSTSKYDSGTGWPSFSAPIANENLRSVELPGLSRKEALESGIEVLCKRCDGHLGHIFGDGPSPTNLRYCINESALRFVARASLP